MNEGDIIEVVDSKDGTTVGVARGNEYEILDEEEKARLKAKKAKKEKEKDSEEEEDGEGDAS